MTIRLDSLSLCQARALVLHCQGLTKDAPFGKGKRGALSALEHISYAQIDTISVVERAHHHVLWSRVPDYQPPMLGELVRDRKVFEYWSHAASYLPIRDYRFSLPRKKAYADGKSHWFQHNKKVMRLVLERIRKEGPLKARDFEAPAGRKSKGWFDWAPAKRALEQLFMAGELMISERSGFEKVYDLTERVLPSGIDARFPSPHETAQHWVESALRANGVVTEEEIRYQRRGFRTELQLVLRELEEEGTLCRVLVEGAGKMVHYVDPKALSALPRSFAPGQPAVRILSPFDNLIIQRKRLKRLFEFEYQIECYTPEHKRKFGYFCLPILIGDQLVGRMDAKADRASKVLCVKGLFIEDRHAKLFAEHAPTFRIALQRFGGFNGCAEAISSF